MTYPELIAELTSRKALIVHCSREGKGNVGPNDPLFPDDLKDAITLCHTGQGDVSCSVVWPDHCRTFGAIGIILKPRSTTSITSAHPSDAGTMRGANGWRTGLGKPFSREAVMETFASSTDYNEWTVGHADTIGIFVNLQHGPLKVGRPIDMTQVPNYDPSIMPATSVEPDPITLDEVCAAFPNLPVYAYLGTQIIQIGIEAKALYP